MEKVLEKFNDIITVRGTDNMVVEIIYHDYQEGNLEPEIFTSRRLLAHYTRSEFLEGIEQSIINRMIYLGKLSNGIISGTSIKPKPSMIDFSSPTIDDDIVEIFDEHFSKENRFIIVSSDLNKKDKKYDGDSVPMFFTKYLDRDEIILGTKNSATEPGLLLVYHNDTINEGETVHAVVTPLGFFPEVSYLYLKNSSN